MVIICFSTKFEVSADLSVIESYLPFVTVINDLWNIVQCYRSQIYVYFLAIVSTVFAKKVHILAMPSFDTRHEKQPNEMSVQ